MAFDLQVYKIQLESAPKLWAVYDNWHHPTNFYTSEDAANLEVEFWRRRGRTYSVYPVEILDMRLAEMRWVETERPRD